MSPVTEGDLALLLELQERVFAALDDWTLLRHNDAEMMDSCLRAPNVTFGAWADGRLAGFSVLYVPEDPAEDLACLLRGVETTRPAANNKLCIVDPDYWGHGLQLRLGELVADEARRRGLRLLCATASPRNSYSCRNLEAQGYRLNRTLVKYGFERNLYVLTL